MTEYSLGWYLPVGPRAGEAFCAKVCRPSELVQRVSLFGDLVGALEAEGGVVRVMLDAPTSCASAHARTQLFVFGERSNRFGERLFAERNQESGFAAAHDFGRAVHVDRDARKSGDHRFDQHETERVVLRRENEKV